MMSELANGNQELSPVASYIPSVNVSRMFDSLIGTKIFCIPQCAHLVGLGLASAGHALSGSSFLHCAEERVRMCHVEDSESSTSGPLIR